MLNRIIERLILAQADWPDDFSAPGAGDDLFWLRVVGTLVVLAAAWSILRPKFDFAIVVSKAGVQIRGRIPEAQRNKIVHFFAEHATPEGTIRISGRRIGRNRLVLAFKGPLDAGLRQQIRNFLISVL